MPSASYREKRFMVRRCLLSFRWRSILILFGFSSSQYLVWSLLYMGEYGRSWLSASDWRTDRKHCFQILALLNLVPIKTPVAEAFMCRCAGHGQEMKKDLTRDFEVLQSSMLYLHPILFWVQNGLSISRHLNLSKLDYLSVVFDTERLWFQWARNRVPESKPVFSNPTKPQWWCQLARYWGCWTTWSQLEISTDLKNLKDRSYDDLVVPCIVSCEKNKLNHLHRNILDIELLACRIYGQECIT